MNIILLVIDTLRYDYVRINGNQEIQTPNLDRFAKRSWRMDNAYSCSYPTIPYRTDVMTGKYGNPFNPWMPLRFDVTTLPEVLAKKGYCTQLIHDTPHLVNGGHNFDWPFHAWTFVRGAEVDRPWISDEKSIFLDNWKHDPVFDSLGDPNLKEVKDLTTVTYSRANRNRKKPEDWNVARLFLSASKWLKNNQKRNNFFLWVDCFDPHGPWDSPPEYIRKYDKTPGYDGRIDPRALRIGDGSSLSQKAKARLKAYYCAKVTHMDRWFGEMLETLEKTHLMDNTAIMVTADHGTCVGERDLFTKWHHLREQEGHVPMFLYIPHQGNGRIDDLIQPQDVFTTLQGLAGIEKRVESKSVNILELIKNKNQSSRKVALAGVATQSWQEKPNSVLFTVFSKKDYLEYTLYSEFSHLTKYGSLENIAHSNPNRVLKLRKLALNELKRRHTSQELLRWLESEGKLPLPEQFKSYPGPKGFYAYWGKTYNKW